MNKQDDLEIYSETSFRTRVVVALDRILFVAFRHPKLANVWDVLALFGVIIVSHQASTYIGSSLFTVVVIAVCIVVSIGWVIGFLLISPFHTRLVFGRP